MKEKNIKNGCNILLNTFANLENMCIPKRA